MVKQDRSFNRSTMVSIVDSTGICALFHIFDRRRIFIYSFKDFKLLTKFGKSGEGPGEFKINSPVTPPVSSIKIEEESNDIDEVPDYATITCTEECTSECKYIYLPPSDITYLGPRVECARHSADAKFLITYHEMTDNKIIYVDIDTDEEGNLYIKRGKTIKDEMEEINLNDFKNINTPQIYYHLMIKLQNGQYWRVNSSTFKQTAARPLITGFNIDKARRELGYEPHSFIQGIAILDSQIK